MRTNQYVHVGFIGRSVYTISTCSAVHKHMGMETLCLFLCMQPKSVALTCCPELLGLKQMELLIWHEGNTDD